ncbi:hypothetical protein IKF81_01510 [Candidatus Saccharibacteria bacterium]|nr:hypothetical protein [Candidatus Saccharibacteria bacterium]
MKKPFKQFKKGATSIYVVVISALLFSVITVSFVRIIINESNRTVSDELSQAAYDSALAGVEDARLAIKKYFECKGVSNGDCENVTKSINESFSTSSSDNPNCDGVAKALNRISNNGEEVKIQETKDNKSDTVQAYTCVILDPETSDYRSTLSSSDRQRVISLKPAGMSPDNVTGVMISWLSNEDVSNINDYNYSNKNSFTSLNNSSTAPTPPTLSAMIIQTAENYTSDSFEVSRDGKTNRGKIFLNPTDGNAGTHVNANTVVGSNDHTTKNTAVPIRCKSRNYNNDKNPDFACTATIQIPHWIDNVSGNSGHRHPDTFLLVVSLPYGQPSTEFAVHMCTDSDGDCLDNGNLRTANFDGVQISVDSTGRANDLYSRVEARLEFNDTYFPYPEFGILATGNDTDAISKNFYVTSECWKTSPDGSVNTCQNTGKAD